MIRTPQQRQAQRPRRVDSVPAFISPTTGRRQPFLQACRSPRSAPITCHPSHPAGRAERRINAHCHRAGLITGGDFESGRSCGGRIGSRDCLAAELGLVSPNIQSPDCTGPRIKGRGWSAQPEVARERFDIDRGGLQQAGDRQERDARRIASRGHAPDDPGPSPGSLRHHQTEHLTAALEALSLMCTGSQPAATPIKTTCTVFGTTRPAATACSPRPDRRPRSPRERRRTKTAATAHPRPAPPASPGHG